MESIIKSRTEIVLREIKEPDEVIRLLTREGYDRKDMLTLLDEDGLEALINQYLFMRAPGRA